MVKVFVTEYPCS